MPARQALSTRHFSHQHHFLELVRRRKIPVLRLSYRTIRFDLAKVQAALEKLELKAIGQ